MGRARGGHRVDEGLWDGNRILRGQGQKTREGNDTMGIGRVCMVREFMGSVSDDL